MLYMQRQLDRQIDLLLLLMLFTYIICTQIDVSMSVSTCIYIYISIEHTYYFQIILNIDTPIIKKGSRQIYIDSDGSIQTQMDLDECRQMYVDMQVQYGIARYRQMQILDSSTRRQTEIATVGYREKYRERQKYGDTKQTPRVISQEYNGFILPQEGVASIDVASSV